jgi:hypothetical protein
MFDCSLRSQRIALSSPPTSSSREDEKHVRSLLLSTAARDPGFDCSLRSLRIALWSPRAISEAHSWGLCLD